MEKVNREDVAGILAEKIMGWTLDTRDAFWKLDGVCRRGHYPDYETGWNPLENELDCARLRDKLAATHTIFMFNPKWGNRPERVWECQILREFGIGLSRYGDMTPAGYREAVCRAALATIGMEMDE